MTTQTATKTRSTDEQLIKRALKAVHAATAGDVTYNSFTSSELRKVFLELAEDGAWTVYEGNGYFDDVHITEMPDRWIARKLINDYEGE